MTDTVAATTRRREATRQKLLDAAAQVFAEVGLDAASVEAICERAGFTRGAFYSNFETKDELFLELAGNVARERVQAVRARVLELEAAGRARAASPADGVRHRAAGARHLGRRSARRAAHERDPHPRAAQSSARRGVPRAGGRDAPQRRADHRRHRPRQGAALPPPRRRGRAPACSRCGRARRCAP